MPIADPTAIALSDDYLTWERLESGTYYPAPVCDDKAVVIAKTKRRAPTIKELAASGGVYTATDLIWIIPRAEAPGLAEQFPPKPGDVFEDEAEGVAWTVLQVMPFGALKSFWRLVTRNLTLAYDLRDTVTIVRPTITTGTAAEPVFTWPPDGGRYIVSELAARVQPSGGDAIGIRNDVETLQKALHVYLATQVDVRMGDRVIVASGDYKGQTLRVLSMSNESRIDELPFLVCERV